jgi:hypothetical protein
LKLHDHDRTAQSYLIYLLISCTSSLALPFFRVPVCQHATLQPVLWAYLSMTTSVSVLIYKVLPTAARQLFANSQLGKHCLVLSSVVSLNSHRSYLSSHLHLLDKTLICRIYLDYIARVQRNIKVRKSIIHF